MLGLALGLAVDAGLLLALALNPEWVRLPADLPRLLTAGVAIAALGWTGLAPLASLVRLLIRLGLWLTREKPATGANGNTPAPAMSTDEPPAVENELTRAERARVQEIAHWRVFYRRLWGAGSAYGWEIRTLATKSAPTYVLSQPAWRIGTDQLKLAGLLYKAPGEPTRALVTSQAWEAGKLWDSVPCPAGEPPEIAAPPYTAQHTAQQTTAKTGQTRVVEGRATPVE